MAATGTRDLRTRPWEGLPAGIEVTLSEGMAGLSEEIIDAIREEVPAYARPLEGAFGEGIRTGVAQALGQFVAMAAGRERGPAASRRIYFDLGRGEAREGRTLEALLAAYRVGARVAWRRVAERAREADIDSEILALLAESIFAYIDELSAESADGFAQEQSAAAGETERRRRRLVVLLLQSPAADEATVLTAARDAGLELPAKLAAMVWNETERRIARRLPAGTIAYERDGTWHALVPDADAPGRRDEIARALRDHPAVIGPPVAWREAARSHGRALALAELIAAGRVAASGLVVADERLAELVVNADAAALQDLADRALAPLAGETPASRERLAGTLRSWLEHQGNVPSIAADLHVHPQTVRYRLGRLREVFGGALDEPAARFDLALALRADPV